MDISIIIVNYNSRDLLMNCIISIVNNLKSINYEIIVVDNHSTDNSLESCKQLNYNEVVIIEPNENLGFGRANNLGVRHATGQILHFLNPDTEIDDKLINDYNKVLQDINNNEQKVYINPMRDFDGTVYYGKNYLQDSRNLLPICFEDLKRNGIILGQRL